MATPSINFDAIAKQYGGTAASLPEASKIDYDALAKQHGAVEGPSVAERFWKATGLPDTYRTLTQGLGDEGDWDPGIVVHNALGMIHQGLQESGGHTVDMMDAASKGKFLEALGQGVVSIPFAGPMIDKFATHLENGELPEAAGTGLMLFGPKILAKGTPIAVDAAKAAAPIIKGAAKGAWEGATAPVPSHLGFDVPASVAGAVKGSLVSELSHLGVPHEVGPVVGALAPAIKGALRGASEARGAVTPVPEVAAAPAGPVAAPGPSLVRPVTSSSLADLTPAELKAAVSAFARDTRGGLRIPKLSNGQPVNTVGDLIDAVKGMAQRRAPEATPAVEGAPEPSAVPSLRYEVTDDAVNNPDIPAGKKVYSVTAYHGDKPVGASQFVHDQATGKLIPETVYVDAGMRRQGVATNMYDAIKAHTGVDSIEPGLRQSPEGIAFRQGLAEKAGASAQPTLADAITGKYDPYAALHDARRGAKIDKVVDTFRKYQFTPELVDRISDTQWKAVAQAAGVNDLTPGQIKMAKAKLKESQ
jgi:hypothetical protein